MADSAASTSTMAGGGGQIYGEKEYLSTARGGQEGGWCPVGESVSAVIPGCRRSLQLLQPERDRDLQ